MSKCKVCKMPIDGDSYIHEYSFGGTLKLEETHSGVCAEEYKDVLEEVLTEGTDDETILTESLEDKFDGYQIL